MGFGVSRKREPQQGLGGTQPETRSIDVGLCLMSIFASSGELPRLSNDVFFRSCESYQPSAFRLNSL